MKKSIIKVQVEKEGYSVIERIIDKFAVGKVDRQYDLDDWNDYYEIPVRRNERTKILKELNKCKSFGINIEVL